MFLLKLAIPARTEVQEAAEAQQHGEVKPWRQQYGHQRREALGEAMRRSWGGYVRRDGGFARNNHAAEVRADVASQRISVNRSSLVCFSTATSVALTTRLYTTR